jgi:hypothetical protein
MGISNSDAEFICGDSAIKILSFSRFVIQILRHESAAPVFVFQ